MLIKWLISTLVILFLAWVLPGITITSFWTAAIVSIVWGLMDLTVKPFLILLTIPITFVTFGLFLIVINVLVILLISHFISGFVVSGFWSAFLFSILYSIIITLFKNK